MFKLLNNSKNNSENYEIPESYNENQKNYVFREMYISTKAAAMEFNEKNKFELKGSYKSKAGNGISLGAFNIPKGSVKVIAGGRLLTEGIDYTVNYQIGRLRILDPSINASNIPLKITVENNSVFGQQNKRFSGFDLIHQFNEKLVVGGNFINLSENPFKKTLKVLEEIIKKTKIYFKFVDLGGGFGIAYKKSDRKINLKNYSNLVEKFRQKYNCSIIFEPGRAIVGDTAILVTKVQYLKKGSNKTFAILNAGMNDFMRTALYDAVHNIIPVIKNGKKNNLWEYYHENGNPKEVEFFTFGILNGTREQYGSGGQLYIKATYKDGKLDGPWIYIDPYDGWLYKKGQYKLGKKTGTWTYYTILGDIEKKEIWKNGLKIFDSTDAKSS